MSVKFDKCPLCGSVVGYEDEAGSNRDLCMAMCIKGHTIVDLGASFELLKSNGYQAARVWNKYVRKYIKEHEGESNE